MSGHSKWHNIQAKKGKADAARGKIFTKLGRELLIAVKSGGPDPNSQMILFKILLRKLLVKVATKHMKKLSMKDMDQMELQFM